MHRVGASTAPLAKHAGELECSLRIGAAEKVKSSALPGNYVAWRSFAPGRANQLLCPTKCPLVWLDEAFCLEYLTLSSTAQIEAAGDSRRGRDVQSLGSSHSDQARTGGALSRRELTTVGREKRLSFGAKTGSSLAVAFLVSAVLGVVAPPKRQTAWRDDFSLGYLDASRWVVASGRAPGYVPGYHIGYYRPSYVSLDSGRLKLLLTQGIGQVDTNPAGVVSQGALIYTKDRYGCGTYQWRMRMSSTVSSPDAPCDPNDPANCATSGSVSAGFIYVNNSQSEIDFEFSGKVFETL